MRCAFARAVAGGLHVGPRAAQDQDGTVRLAEVKEEARVFCVPGDTERDGQSRPGPDRAAVRHPAASNDKGGRYKRDFGVPEDKAQENFTDPDSRIMKRAAGGFDAAYDAQLAVDEAAHIIGAAN
jgi:hypothetical protein